MVICNSECFLDVNFRGFYYVNLGINIFDLCISK